MKFRFLVAALAVVAAGGLFLGSRAGTASAAAGPDIELTCPAVVLQGAGFTCQQDWGPITDPVTGYQFVIIYDSPVGPSGTPAGTGTGMTVNSVTKLYNANAMWGAGGEFCPPSTFNAANPLLPTGYMGSGTGCVSLDQPAQLHPAAILTWNITANGLGNFPVHQVSLGAGGATFGTYTIDGGSAPHTNLYVCGGVNCIPSPFMDPTVPQDPLVTIVQPPADVSITKAFSVASVVAGQPISVVLTVTNNSATTAAPGVQVTDTFAAAFTGLTINPADPNCSFLGQVLTCNIGSLGAGASYVIGVDAVVDTSAGGTTQNNCANVTTTSVPADPNSANNQGCDSVVVIPPAVAWSKDPSNYQVFLCEAGTIGINGCTADGKNGTVTFNEVLTNQGDPAGLGAYEFTILYDNSIFGSPTIVDSGVLGSTGRPVTCSMSIFQETQVHWACASIGLTPLGPIWVGPMVMATVTFPIKAVTRGALYPHKHNGIVTRIDDVGTEVANICGQPLNDGTEPPLPGQTNECQGNLLLGVLPGGLLPDSTIFVTIRRLEGDLDKDCDVDVADMQNISGRYGFGYGSLLYQIWYDLEPHTTGADGDLDIKDVQFVFGRSGSTCTTPVPPQTPQLPVDP